MLEWFVGISITVFYLLQTALADKIAVFGIAPDLVFVAIVCYSILAGKEKGAAAAIFAGIPVDILSSGIFGGNLLLYTYAAVFAGIMGNNFFGKNSLTAMFITFVLSLCAGIITALAMYLAGMDRNILYVIFAAALPRSVYNCIISAFYYALIDNIAVRNYR